MLKVSLAFVCAALMAGSAAAADIPEGSQLVTRAKDLAVVDGGNKVFYGQGEDPGLVGEASRHAGSRCLRDF